MSERVLNWIDLKLKVSKIRMEGDKKTEKLLKKHKPLWLHRLETHGLPDDWFKKYYQKKKKKQRK